MLRHRNRHRLASLMLLAMLMAALAPTVSRALTAGQPAAWGAVCSAAGTPRLAVGDATSARDGTPPQPGPVTPGLDHCPYCALHVDALAVPPGLAPVPLPLALTDALPRAFLHAPRTLDVWARAQPRAPPPSRG